MTVDFAKEYLLDNCADCPENKDGECMTQSHCFEVKRMAIQALEQTRWIPVSERLPEDKTYVLTTIKVPSRIAHARSGWYEGGFFHNDNGDTWKATDMEVLAWMPLPQPYKGESEEISDRNMKMWEEIFAEERRRKERK